MEEVCSTSEGIVLSKHALDGTVPFLELAATSLRRVVDDADFDPPYSVSPDNPFHWTDLTP